MLKIYIYLRKKSNVVCFTERVQIAFLKYKFVDIFTNESIGYLTNSELYDEENGCSNLYFCTVAKEVFHEMCVYLDGMVPKMLIQKLYYQVNGIDEKVLKLGAMKD